MPIALSDDEIQTIVAAFRHLNLMSPLTEEERDILVKFQAVQDRRAGA